LTGSPDRTFHEEYAMPDAKNNAKKTGDTHPPDVESELPLREGTTGGGADDAASERGQASRGGDQNRPGRGVRKAGVVKDQDAPSSDSSGDARDPGESSGPRKG
jgi:hypothetical protein